MTGPKTTTAGEVGHVEEKGAKISVSAEHKRRIDAERGGDSQVAFLARALDFFFMAGAPRTAIRAIPPRGRGKTLTDAQVAAQARVNKR